LVVGALEVKLPGVGGYFSSLSIKINLAMDLCILILLAQVLRYITFSSFEKENRILLKIHRRNIFNNIYIVLKELLS
jgi:hypothetical protein